jgi:hypothetical protein
MRAPGPPDWLCARVARGAGLFSKCRREESLDAEVREHSQLLAEENLCRGMTPEEARATRHDESSAVWSKSKKTIERPGGCRC